MSYFFGVANLIAFDLVYVDSLGEFVCLTEGNYRHFMLACDIGNHRSSHLRDDTTITEYVASSNEKFGSFIY